MRLTLAALVAVAAFGAATAPAAACGFFTCAGVALSDDAYPVGNPQLDPRVQEMVKARNGMGLSTAGFYNDPSLALARRDYAPPPPPYEPVSYGEPAQEGGPEVIISPYGHRGYGHAHGYGRRHHHGSDPYLR